MKTQFTLIFLFITGIMGCSSYRIARNQGDKSTNWTTYRTFAFIDTTRIDPTPSAAYQAAIAQVERAVGTELTKRGYQQLASNQPASQSDLLVNIGVVVNEKTQTRQTTIYEAPRYIGQRRYHWQSQDVPVSTYKEGTISLHIVDAKQNALIWDAAVASVLGKKGATPEQINEAVNKVFTKFPGNRQ
ncbi:DUF4136 domain-containing protein [soil metagenome]